jgi:hypothetical protein
MPLFSSVNLERRVPAKHLLRVIKAMVGDARASLDAEFEALYGTTGRSSIALERQLRASLLQLDVRRWDAEAFTDRFEAAYCDGKLPKERRFHHD